MILDGTERQNSVERAACKRREAFVQAAREAFFAHGYGGTSMSAICARVGGSKTTMWTHFPSKQDLFIAVLDDLFERYNTALSVDLTPGEDVGTALRRLGLALLNTWLLPAAIDMQRLVTGEAGRFPELARIYYERGPVRGKARLAAFLADAMARGVVRKGDPVLAAHHFAGLCHHGSAQMCLLGLADPPGAEQREREVDVAVVRFLGGWGVSPDG
jgi:AcrR family transcriptional regulator